MRAAILWPLCVLIGSVFVWLIEWVHAHGGGIIDFLVIMACLAFALGLWFDARTRKP